MAGGYDNSLAQLETSWGKARSSWSLDDWRRAAETLERALAVAGGLLSVATEIAGKAVAIRGSAPPLAKQSFQKRRGRPCSNDRQRIKESSKRSSKKKPKYSQEQLFVLVCAVEALKIKASKDGKKLTDKIALQMCLKKKPGELDYMFLRRVESKLAPLLSRTRTQLHKRDKGFEEQIQLVANAWANNS